jgi:hypothetical protein
VELYFPSILAQLIPAVKYIQRKFIFGVVITGEQANKAHDG